jgi:hypothetical protein
MESRDKTICKDFANEVWLFLDQDLPAARMDYWNGHIQECDTCSALVDSISIATNSAKEDLYIELADPAFDKMIASVFTIKKSAIFGLQPKRSGYNLFTASRIKYSIAAGLIILAFLFSFNITKENPKRTFRSEVQEEIPHPTQATLSQMVEMVYGSEMDRQIGLLEVQVKELNIK